MVNVVASAQEIQNQIQEAVARHNARVTEFNALPENVRAQFDTQLFDDMDLLIRYINALTATLAEAAEKPVEGGKFEF